MSFDKILWVARCPTPYRYPIWSTIHGDGHELTVAFLQRRGIGRPWLLQTVEFPQIILSAKGIRYKEDALWVLLPCWHKHLAKPSVIVLQGMWETPAAWQIRAYAKRHNIPIVYFHESTVASHEHPNGIVGRARSKFLRSAQAILTPGPQATEAALAAGVDAQAVVTSFNVVDVDGFNVRAVAKRQAAGVTPSGYAGHRFLFVGKLIPRKNVQAIIDAFTQIAHDEDTLTIVGDGPSGDELRHHALSSRARQRIRFCGELDESSLLSIMAVNHTLVLASLQEVWGLVVNEALAAGLQAVVTERAGVASSVRGMQGVFISGSERKSLAKAMLDARNQWTGWQDHPEILQHNARAFVQDFYSAWGLAQEN